MSVLTSSFAVTASHVLNTSTLQQVTTAGNTTDQALIVTGSSIFRTTTGAGAGGRIELSNGNYSSINSPVMSFIDSSDYNNVVIGQSVNDGLIQVYDHPDRLRTVIAANFVCFDPGQTGNAGVYFGVTSSAADGSNRSYVKIREGGYSGIPYHTLTVAHKSGGTTSGSITLGGISQTTATSAPSIQIASNDGVRVVNFGGPGFNHSNGVHNNYLKYGLQIGGDYTGYTSNMPLTDGSLIMSGSTGAFSVKSVSSEAEIKTNNGATTLTLGTTSSFSYVSASAFEGDGSGLTNVLPAGVLSGSVQIASDISGSFVAPSASFSTRVASLESNGVFTAAGISGSLGANATLIRSLTSTSISGSFVAPSSSFSTRVTTLENAGGGETPTFIASGSTSASADPGTGVVVNHSGSTAFSVIGDVGTLFSVDDSLTGTLFSTNDISGFPILQADSTGEVYLGKSPQSLYTTAVVSSTNANESHSLCTLSTSSYDGGFFEYTAHSASNARAGNIMSTWNGSNIVYAETTTMDIGDTSDLKTEVIISGSTARLIAYGPNASYKIKTIIKAI